MEIFWLYMFQYGIIQAQIKRQIKINYKPDIQGQKVVKLKLKTKSSYKRLN